ncbi:hypothetical protein Tco_0573720 [Tanacetum coccineum]
MVVLTAKLEVNNARGLRRSTAPDTAAELVLLAEVSTASRIVSSQVIMSSTTSDVTYTSVYTESEPDRAFWGADDEEIPEGGIPRVIVLGYDGLPLQPVALPSPDITRPRCKSTTPPVSLRKASMSVAMFVQAHDPDYVPEPIYPEYIPLEEDHEFPAEEQPLPHIDSPTAESPRYVTELDPEEDPEEDDTNDEDEDDKDGEEEEEEEEHLAPTDSTIWERLAKVHALHSHSRTLTTIIWVSNQILDPNPYESKGNQDNITSTQPLHDGNHCQKCNTITFTTTTTTNSYPYHHLLAVGMKFPSLSQPPRNEVDLSTIGLDMRSGEFLLAQPYQRTREDYGFVNTGICRREATGIRECGYGLGILG